MQHIGCSHSWAHALGTLLFLFTQAQAHELQVKWIVHLYIHNKSYKLRALFLPTGFFPLNQSGVSTNFFFSTWTLVHHRCKSFFINKSTQTKKASKPTLQLTPSQGRSGTGRGEWSVRIIWALKVDIGCQRCQMDGTIWKISPRTFINFPQIFCGFPAIYPKIPCIMM